MINIIIPTTPERSERLKESLESIKDSICDQELVVTTEVSSGEGAIKPTLRMLEKIDGIVIPMSDDVIVTPYAIQRLYDSFIREFPEQDGVCAPYECDVFLTHSKVMKKYWHPGYFHLFCDREFFEIMYRLRKVYRVPAATIHHNHFSFNESLNDATYDWATNHRADDERLYHERYARNFDIPDLP